MDVIQEIDEFGEHFHEDEVMPKIPSANSRKSCWKRSKRKKAKWISMRTPSALIWSSFPAVS